MTADVEVLPCPWCGGKIEGNVSEGSTFRWRKVDGCCADGPEVRHNTTAPDQGIAEHESRIAAIKAWNTRAATAAQAAEIEALRAEASTAHSAVHYHIAEHAKTRARAERLAEVLRVAEAALSDIGDADREEGDDLAWCERRAAEPLPMIRALLRDQEEGK